MSQSKYNGCGIGQTARKEHTMTTIRIYQLKSDSDPRLFRSFADAVKAGGFDRNAYSKVYETEYRDTPTLEEIFQIFNETQPEGYTGHSLSVSDLVEMQCEGQEPATYYCEPIGWRMI